MRKLIAGLREFKANYVSSHQDLLEHLAHGQKPRVLFITCSDSRIAPNMLTNTDLGDLFVIRNAGNIIPPYGAANGGEGAAVEYAVHALGIDQIVVCGHSHCGAMKGLLQLGKLEEEMPLVYDWLKHAEATRRLVKENYASYGKEELLEVTIAENVLTQMENLRTYPVVRSKIFQGKLHIYGWVYLIETGEVLAYDPETHSYLPPQSQLIYEPGDDPAPQTYVRTTAPTVPTVACELPQWQTHLEDEPAQPATPTAVSTPGNGMTSNGAASNGATNGATSNGSVAPALSNETAKRIYRGVRAKRRVR